MKPILFAKNETNFTSNGLGRLDCISCEVVEERNGMYELEAEIPITGAHANEIEMHSIIGVVPHEGSNIQAFYVYKIGKPISGRFRVYGRHISYRLTDIPCMPFSVDASPQAAAQTLAGLKSNAIEACPFNFYTDITTPASYTQKTPASIRQRLGGVEGSILDQFGGEYEWDNFNVRLLKQRGRLANTTGITLRYGKNITDINQEEEIANTVTGVVPFWIDTDGNNLVMLSGSPNDPVVYSDNAENYPYHLTQILDLSSEFQEKPTQAQLRTVAQIYVTKDGFGEPKVSIKVSFVDLWKSEEYKDIAPLERVQLCDEITVDFEKLGIKALAKVVKTDYDVLKERYNSIEVGSIRTTLAQAVTDRDKDIDTAFVNELTRVNTAISNATAWLTSANGYVVAVKNDDGSWKELFLMNTNDPQTATQGIRFNNNGLGFFNKALHPGGNILSGPYDMAWTIDGRLGDFANKNYWNFINGEFSLSATATVGGKTVDAIAQEKANAAQAAAESVAAAALSAAVDDLQGQIDGNITSWFYNYAPTTSNVPASTWTTVDDKINHIGDLFYNSTTGYCYRWQIKADAADPAHPTANDFEWVRISDEDISEALSKAQTAQDTADNKRRVFITQPVPPYDIGDLWTMGASGDILTCTTAKTESGVYDAADWSKLNKYTDDTAVNSLNTALTQQEIFNRLTNNGETQGIYLQNGKLYINASYIGVGIIADRAGKFSLNMDTGALSMRDGSFSGNVSASTGNFGALKINSNDSSIYAEGVLNLMDENIYLNTSGADRRYKYDLIIDTAYFSSDTYLSYTYYTLTGANGDYLGTVSLYRYYADGSIGSRLEYTSIYAVGNFSSSFSEHMYANNGMYLLRFSLNYKGFYRSLNFKITTTATLKSLLFSGANGIVAPTIKGSLSGKVQASDFSCGGWRFEGLNKRSLIFGEVDSSEDYVRLDVFYGLTINYAVQSYMMRVGLTEITRIENGVTWYAQFYQGSDERIKENIKPIDTDLSVKLIDKTEPKSFTFIHDTGTHYGMIAQEARAVLDSLGEYDAKLEHELNLTEPPVPNMKTIEYNEYIPHLINYVKDLREIVNQQQAEIDELKEIVKRLTV